MTTWSGSAAQRFQAWRADLHELDFSCVRFGRLLRSRGVPVTPEQVMRWIRALELTGCAQPADLYWSGRVTLVSRREHLPAYDELFRRFWLTLDHAALPAAAAPAAPGPAAPPRPPGRGDREPPAAGRDGPRGERQGAAEWLLGWRAARGLEPAAGASPDQGDPVPGAYSPAEVQRAENTAWFDPADQAALAALLRRAAPWAEPRRLSRRWGPARHGRQVDLRRTLAAAARTAGEPLRLFWRRRRRQWRRWVFLCDVSASMGPLAQTMLLFLHLVAARRPHTEVFFMGTRLTRITPMLRRVQAGRLERLVATLQDWQGGTRLGTALHGFNAHYGRRGMAHGAVVVVLSDGLDQGEAEEVQREMAALRRRAWRILWVNPLKRSERYQPLARAMAEALPHLDELLGGHDMAGLVRLLDRLAELG